MKLSVFKFAVTGLLLIQGVNIFAQSTLKLGIGYFKDIEKRPFYAPVVMQNSQFGSVAISEGEPIIEFNGKSIKIYENLLADETAFLKSRETWAKDLSDCNDCNFRTMDIGNAGKKSWVGYKEIFCFGNDFNRTFHRSEPDLSGGFLGLTYKVQKKSNTAFTYLPVVQDVVKGSPAESAGILIGDEITGIESAKGGKETFYNMPLEWIIEQMKGDIGEKVVLYINGNTKKTIERANLYGEVTAPQVIKNCVSGDCFNGKGVMKSGSETYNGYFAEGKYDGRGKILKNEQVVFEGNFKNGKKNGSGTEFRQDGIQVETIYANGKPGNSNKFTLPNGFAYYEVWKGEFKAYYDLSMNPISEQQYLAGVKSGSFKPNNTSDILYADNMTPKTSELPMRGSSTSAKTTTTPAKTTTPSVTTPAKTTTSPVTTPAKTTTPSVTTPAKTTTPSVTTPAKTTTPSVTTPAKTTTPSVTTPAKTTTPPVTTPAKTTTPPVTTPAKTTTSPVTTPAKTTTSP
ncbi:MAG: PDZ domain-containing protein, partial [Bacteroidia bacterium]|nr:PDZ domain-containing protein [Bacteroidia bacterium]